MTLKGTLESKATLVVLTLSLVAVLGFVIVAAIKHNDQDRGAQTGKGGSQEGAIQVEQGGARDKDSDAGQIEVAYSASYAFDAEDERQLIGTATNVFVGRVRDRLGTEELPASGPYPGPPVTRFEVKVLQNIKGEAGDTVTVAQGGGYDERVNKAITVQGDSLLDPGQVYLLVVNHVPEKGWYRISAQPFGDRLIKDDVQREELVNEFRMAANNQAIPSPENPGETVELKPAKAGQ